MFDLKITKEQDELLQGICDIIESKDGIFYKCNLILKKKTDNIYQVFNPNELDLKDSIFLLKRE